MAMNESLITNTSTVSSSLELEESAPEDSNVYLIFLTFLSSVLISSGSILTIVAIATNTPLQTNSNAFVASLAAADLVVGVAVFSFGLWLVPSVRNLFESAIYICVVQLSNAFMSIFVSIYSMLLVAIDRWLIISRPFLYQRIVGKKVIASSILLPWMFGLVFGFSQFFILNPDQDPPVCRITSLYPSVYYQKVMPVAYYVAVLGIFGFYFQIVLIARHHGKAIQRQNRIHANLVTVADRSDGTFKNNNSNDNSNKNSDGYQSKTANSNSTKNIKNKHNKTADGRVMKFNEQHWKAAKMMMTVFGVFFVCWTPKIVLYTFGRTSSGLLSDVTVNLGLLNSGVNFIVYPLHNQEFRMAFKRIVCFWRLRR